MGRADAQDLAAPGFDAPEEEPEDVAGAEVSVAFLDEDPPVTTSTTHVHRTTTTVKRASAAGKSTTAAVKSTPTTSKPKAKATSSGSGSTTTTTKPKDGSTTASTNDTREQRGVASWYSDAEPGYCAHRTLPKGTKVWVEAVPTGKEITCVVNDRGPYIDGRIIDLSKEDFVKLTAEEDGLVEVRISW